MKGVKQEIDWQRYDELKAQGLQGRPLARKLGIPDTTLRNAEKRRPQEQQGTPQVPIRVPQETQISTTATPTTPATTSDLQQLLQAQESRLMAYIERRIQEAIEHQELRVPLDVPEQRRRPMGTPVPEYPDDPQKGVRLNLHLTSRELWEIHTVAAAYGMNVSQLMRRVWQIYRQGAQVQQVLQQAHNSKGGEGSGEEIVEEDA
jgi:hypothetical protein